MKTNFIFIAGIPACGKTTIARELAIRLNADKVIDLDVLKNSCKLFVNSDKEPYLYTTSHEAFNVEGLSLIEGFLRYSRCIQTYLLNLLKQLYNERVVIVEGVQLLPEILEKIDKKKANCYFFNLIIDEKGELINRINYKLKNRQGKWIEHLSEILELQNYIKNLPNQNNIVNLEKEKTIYEIMEELKNENLYS